MKTVEKLSENILDKLSIDFLRNQVLKNAYGNNDTVIAGMDSAGVVSVFWSGSLVCKRPAFPDWLLSSGSSHDDDGEGGGTRPVSFRIGRIFANRVFADCHAAVRW